jgi:hypothetical protein
MDPLQAFEGIMIGFGVLFLLYWSYRLTHPFMCTCGFQSRWLRRFHKHVTTRHVWNKF